MIRALALAGRLRLVVGILAALVVVGVAAPFAVARMNALPDDAVFELDGKVVTVDDLDDRLVVLEALYGVQRPEPGSDSADDFNRDAAKSMAVSEVLATAAAERAIVVSDKVARDTLDKLIDQQLAGALGGGRQAFDEYLATSGISETDVLDEIKRQLATSQLVEAVTEDVPAATDEEIRTAYDDHAEAMTTPEARHLRNIVVGSRSEAERVLRLARSGRSFTRLAATFSRDGSTRASGGDLGILTVNQLEADFAAAAFAAPTGGLFGPVRTRFGWNVGQVVDVTAATPLSFEQVREQIATELQNKERLEVWSDYLASLLKDADVEYADAYRPDNPDAAPSELPATQGDRED